MTLSGKPALAGPESTPAETDDEGWLISPGDMLPDVALRDVDGVDHHLGEFAGRPLVLIFWGTW